MSSKSTSKTANFAGIISAGICMIHCAAFPVLFSASTLAHSDSDWSHYFFIGVAFVAVYYSTRKKGDRTIYNLLWMFTVVFSLAVVFHHEFWAMVYVSLTASFVLLVLHILNHRRQKRF